MTRRVAVTGASGKTGRAVAAALRARGAEVVPIGRAQWADLVGAFRGCDAAYLIAPNLHQDEPGHVTVLLDAARGAGVERVGYHSVTAPYAPAMPHHLGKAVAEDLVRRSGVAWTVLQPCAYTQNLLPQLGSGVLEVPYDVTRPFGLVDLDDVGEAAATVLLDDAHVGATYELGGPALVSVTHVARAASEVLGREIGARRVPLPGDVHPWLAAMFAYYDAHGLPAGPVPLRALLGREPRSVVDTIRRSV